MSYAYCLLLSDRRKKYYERSVELLFKMVSHVHALKSSIPEKSIENRKERSEKEKLKHYICAQKQDNYLSVSEAELGMCILK